MQKKQQKNYNKQPILESVFQIWRCYLVIIILFIDKKIFI